jgi:hypothetical protein
MNRDTFIRLRRAARIAPDAGFEIRHNGRLFLFGRRATPYFVGDTYLEHDARAYAFDALNWAASARLRGDKAFARQMLALARESRA